MDVRDIQKCARYFKNEYLEKFYIVTTFSENSFILVAEKFNFPHLMGIKKNIYRSNGYSTPIKLYEDILKGLPIPTAIIPNNISPNSKMFNKAENFNKSIDILWHNKGPLAINYNSSKSSSYLDNVDILLIDLKVGYMTGWIDYNEVPINTDIKFKKYCISSWIDESKGNDAKKQKYMPSQDIDLIKSVLAFSNKSELIREKKYTYKKDQKREILKAVAANNSNLKVNNRNAIYYQRLAINEGIHCKINNVQY